MDVGGEFRSGIRHNRGNEQDAGWNTGSSGTTRRNGEEDGYDPSGNGGAHVVRAGATNLEKGVMS